MNVDKDEHYKLLEDLPCSFLSVSGVIRLSLSTSCETDSG